MAVTDQLVTEDFAIYCGDALEALPGVPEGTVGLSVYSPPFATSEGGALYHYSSSDRDLSNARDLAEFMEHYRFMVRELFRVTMPSRVSAVHCMDVPSGNTGKDSVFDFPGEIIRLHESEGWWYIGRRCVWKEPLTVRNRTMMKSLAHKTIIDDSAWSGVAAADQLLFFRKPGENPAPIHHENGFLSYAGAREIPRDLLPYRGWTGDQKENRFSHWIWRQYASAFWDDVRLDRVLPFKPAREEDDEKHVHPLQLDVIERCVALYSNPGETVADPVMGVGSTPYVAVEMNRRGIGVELKPSYYKQAARNLAAVEKKMEGDQMTLAEAAS